MKACYWMFTLLSLPVNLSLAENFEAKKPRFADASLLKIIDSYLQGNDNNISSLQTIDHLSAENAGIKNLEGIEYLTALKSLSLAGNEIENIQPLAKLNNLTKLNLSHNNIKRPSALVRLSLKYLDLSHNRLKYGFLMCFLELEELDISHNEVQQLNGDFGKLRSLKYFNASNNPINLIPKEFECPVLETLDLSATKVSSLANLAALKNLKVLTVKDCPFLKSIEPLFLDSPMGLICTFQNLERLEITLQYLNEPSQKILEKLRQSGCGKYFEFNGLILNPEKKSSSEHAKPHILLKSKV